MSSSSVDLTWRVVEQPIAHPKIEQVLSCFGQLRGRRQSVLRNSLEQLFCVTLRPIRPRPSGNVGIAEGGCHNHWRRIRHRSLHSEEHIRVGREGCRSAKCDELRCWMTFSNPGLVWPSIPSRLASRFQQEDYRCRWTVGVGHRRSRCPVFCDGVDSFRVIDIERRCGRYAQIPQP